MIELRQGTVGTVIIGPFIDNTDGKTPLTGLTIAQADCQIMKNGGAAAQKNDATSATHRVSGYYSVPLNTTDTNTLGAFRLEVQATGALAVFLDVAVLSQAFYDAKYSTAALATASALATVQADTDDIQTRLPAALVSGRMDASVGAMATDVITSGALAASAVTEIQSGLATASALTAIGSDVSAILVDTGTDIPASIALVQADTDNIQTRIPAALISGRIDATVGAMQTDTLTASALASSAVTEIQTGLATSTALSAVASNVTDILADTGTDIPASITAMQADVSAILVDTGTDIPAALAAINADTDNIQTRLPAALVGGRMDSLVGSMATDVITATSVSAGAVTKIQNGLATSTALAVVDGIVDDILVDTGTTIPAQISGLNNLSQAQAQVAAAAALTAYDPPTYTEMAAAFAALNNLSPAQAQAAAAAALAAYDPPTNTEMLAAFAALNDISVADINTGISVDGYTMQEALRIALSVLAGRLSGANTNTETFRNLTNTKNRVVATVETDGDRTNIVIDAS